MSFSSKRDVLTADGADSESYLHGQISQNVDDMADGESRLSFLLEPRGNVESCFRITRLRQDHYLLDTESGHGSLLLESLERFKLRSKIEFVLHDWKMVSILGDCDSADFASTLLSVESPWPGLKHVDLLAENPAVDLPVCSYEEYERLRFSHGLPVIGREFDVGAIPNETDLLGLAVSFDKGCYRGQELVERIDARKGGRRLLRRIRSDATLSPKENLFSEGKEIGEVLAVTSSAPYIGFASVRGEAEGIENDAGGNIEVFPLNEVIQ
ncbi:MAG: hypothetical protein VYB56_05630 [Actinomycetota bacterium]|nr:hypothetical protein [Actinomycetota bacterium]MED5293318.1 hypothetical protein [Actinomycetota bacterium]